MDVRVQPGVKQVPSPGEGGAPVSGIQYPWTNQSVWRRRRQAGIGEEGGQGDRPMLSGRRARLIDPRRERQAVDKERHGLFRFGRKGKIKRLHKSRVLCFDVADQKRAVLVAAPLAFLPKFVSRLSDSNAVAAGIGHPSARVFIQQLGQIAPEGQQRLPCQPARSSFSVGPAACVFTASGATGCIGCAFMAHFPCGHSYSILWKAETATRRDLTTPSAPLPGT